MKRLFQKIRNFFFPRKHYGVDFGCDPSVTVFTTVQRSGKEVYQINAMEIDPYTQRAQARKFDEYFKHPLVGELTLSKTGNFKVSPEIYTTKLGHGVEVHRLVRIHRNDTGCYWNKGWPQYEEAVDLLRETEEMISKAKADNPGRYTLNVNGLGRQELFIDEANHPQDND